MSRRVLLAAAGACAVATLAVAVLPQVAAHAREAAKDASAVGCDGRGRQSTGNLTTRRPQPSPATNPVFQGGVLVATGPANGNSPTPGGSAGESLQSRQASKQTAPTEGVTFTHEKLERARASKGGEIYVESYSWGVDCPPPQRPSSRRAK